MSALADGFGTGLSSEQEAPAVHDEAPTAGDTDWSEILLLYGLLERAAPNPVVTLNRAVAVAMVDGLEASIIGGAQIFTAALPLAGRMIVTEIAHTFDCDTFFPPIDPAVWVETAREAHRSEANGVDYAYVTYVRHA